MQDGTNTIKFYLLYRFASEFYLSEAMFPLSEKEASQPANSTARQVSRKGTQEYHGSKFFQIKHKKSLTRFYLYTSEKFLKFVTNFI